MDIWTVPLIIVILIILYDWFDFGTERASEGNSHPGRR